MAPGLGPLRPGAPGPAGTRVTLGVLVGEVDGHGAALVLAEAGEQVLDGGGEGGRHLVPLLRILLDVEQVDGLQRLRHQRAVVAGPREPDVTA